MTETLPSSRDLVAGEAGQELEPVTATMAGTPSQGATGLAVDDLAVNGGESSEVVPRLVQPEATTSSGETATPSPSVEIVSQTRSYVSAWWCLGPCILAGFAVALRLLWRGTIH